MKLAIDLSVVVPVFNEEENLPFLVDQVRGALDHLDWELLLVDDGSTDATGPTAEALAGENPRIRVLRLARNYGQTTALQAGFDHARGEVVVTMDGDLQNDPRDIPKLVEALAGGYDLAIGYRVDRKDRFLTRKLPSAVANHLINRVTRVPVRDAGCTLKAYRRELLERFVLYAEQHRFIPALAVSHGARVVQVPVRHHSRRFGRSKYGLSRTFKVPLDLLAVRIIAGLRRRPGLAFSLALPVGLCATAAFTAAWIIALVAFRPIKAEALVFPGAALLCAATTLYLVMLGLVAEVAASISGAREQLTAVVRELE